jgi:hypothetical protein
MPGTELRTAFSMTVEPLSASMSKRVPSKATIVSFVIMGDPEVEKGRDTKAFSSDKSPDQSTLSGDASLSHDAQ